MSSIFEELRALDDRDEVRSPRYASTRLPLWPFVRWIAFSAAQDAALGLQPAFATGRTLFQTASVVARSQIEGPLSAQPAPIVIVGSSGGIVLQRAGRWFDRINDYFALERDTLVLDKAGPAGYRRPRVPKHVRCYDTFDIRAGMLAKLRRPADADLAAIDQLAGSLQRVLRVPTAAIRGQLVHWAVRLPILHELWKRAFDHLRPRLLVVEDGHYGAFTHLLAWAHAAGIATAEFQHGVISRSHLAYNTGVPAAQLPQHLLLYGDAWRTEVGTPATTHAIGCPHFTETAPQRAAGDAIVTISQGTRTEAMVRLTTAVARRYPAQQCVFRLHPGEVAFRERYASLAELPNVELSDRGDLYAVLARARVVIGHSSTALVEAAGIGLPVCILDEPSSRAYLPRETGTWFATDEELLALVASPPAPTVTPDRFFAPGWRAAYRTFCDTLPW